VRQRKGADLFSEEAGQKVPLEPLIVAQSSCCGTASHFRSDKMTTAAKQSETLRAQAEVAMLWLKISCVNKSYDNAAHKNYRLPQTALQS